MDHYLYIYVLEILEKLKLDSSANDCDRELNFTMIYNT